MRRLYYINRHSYNLFHSPSIENGVVTIKTFDNKSITITEKSYVEDFVPIAPFWRHLKSEEVAIYEDTKSESDIVLRYADDAHDNKYHVTPKELMTEWQSFKHNPKTTELPMLEGKPKQLKENPFMPPFDQEFFKPGVWPEGMGQVSPFEMQELERPSEIKILNLDYEITWIDGKDEQEHNKFGWCDANEQRIKVCKERKPKKIAETFIHEIIHGQCIAMDLEDSQNPREAIAARLSTAICALWQQNPEAMEWWRRMNTGGK